MCVVWVWGAGGGRGKAASLLFGCTKENFQISNNQNTND